MEQEEKPCGKPLWHIVSCQKKNLKFCSWICSRVA